MVVVTRGSVTAIFAPDGTLKTGWITNNKRQSILLAEYFEKNGTRLCNSVGTDLTHGIAWTLAHEPPSDILVKAENGVYQAVLLGNRKNGEFYVEYLCSVSPGAGVWLLNKVKDYVATRPTDIRSVVLHPLPAVRGYYESKGFAEKSDEIYGYKHEWKPTTGGRRKTLKRTKIRATRKNKKSTK